MYNICHGLGDRDVRITNRELHSIPLHNDPLGDDRYVRITNRELHSIPLHNDPYWMITQIITMMIFPINILIQISHLKVKLFIDI